MGRYIRGQIEVNKDLGTFQAQDVQVAATLDTVVEKTLLSSIKCLYATGRWVDSEDDGPIMVGVAHIDYTAAQIESWLEAIDTWDEGDLLAQEVNKRLIRKIGVFSSPRSDTAFSHLNDGKPIRTKLNWLLKSGETVQFWFYNQGSSAFTTGPHVLISGQANLWPR